MITTIPETERMIDDGAMARAASPAVSLPAATPAPVLMMTPPPEPDYDRESPPRDDQPKMCKRETKEFKSGTGIKTKCLAHNLVVAFSNQLKEGEIVAARKLHDEAWAERSCRPGAGSAKPGGDGDVVVPLDEPEAWQQF